MKQTPNLGLTQMETPQDGNKTFNLETMLNEPFTKIDDFAGKIMDALQIPALGNYRYLEITQSTTWTAPANLIGGKVHLLMCGGGGCSNGRSGGGSGYIVEKILNIEPSSSHTVIIGASTRKQDGGSTKFDAIEALGGKRGDNTKGGDGNAGGGGGYGGNGGNGGTYGGGGGGSYSGTGGNGGTYGGGGGIGYYADTGILPGRGGTYGGNGGGKNRSGSPGKQPEAMEIYYSGPIKRGFDSSGGASGSDGYQAGGGGGGYGGRGGDSVGYYAGGGGGGYGGNGGNGSTAKSGNTASGGGGGYGGNGGNGGKDNYGGGGGGLLTQSCFVPHDHNSQPGASYPGSGYGAGSDGGTGSVGMPGVVILSYFVKEDQQ